MYHTTTTWMAGSYYVGIIWHCFYHLKVYPDFTCHRRLGRCKCNLYFFKSIIYFILIIRYTDAFWVAVNASYRVSKVVVPGFLYLVIIHVLLGMPPHGPLQTIPIWYISRRYYRSGFSLYIYRYDMFPVCIIDFLLYKHRFNYGSIHGYYFSLSFIYR